MITERSQRWRDRRAMFVPTADEIDPRRYTVAAIDRREAKAFVERHHYSGTFPAARLSVGLFETVGPTRSLAGVAVFSVPVNDRCVKKSTGLADPLAAADLGRFVLTDDVAGNGETFFLARALKVLRREKPGIVAVISYADPVERKAADGTVTKRGHVGNVYRMLGAAYLGRSTARNMDILPDGRTFSARAASKIRGGERGRTYAIGQLRSWSAAGPGDGCPGEWLDALRRDGVLRRERHPGCHTYCWPLTRAAEHAGRPNTPGGRSPGFRIRWSTGRRRAPT